MINLKTGAISVPGILSNLLYKDIAQGLNSYGGYSDDSMAGPQSPDAFSVTPDTYNDMYNSVGIDPDTARSVGSAVTKGLNSTLGVAALGPLAGLAEIANNAVDANQGKNPGNTTAVGRMAENLSKATTGRLGEIDDPIGFGLELASSFSGPVSGYVNAVSDVYGLARDTAGFLSDLAKDDDTTASPSGFGGFRGFSNDLDAYADAFSLNDVDISPVDRADAIAGRGDTSGSSNSSSSSGSTDSSSDRGSSRGMGGVTGRGGEDSDEGSAGAGW